MLYNHFTEKFLGLQDVIVKNIENESNNIKIFCSMERKKHKCPCCGAETDTVHDYRQQTIKDIPALGKNTLIILNKRRYRCRCGKRFSEKVSFLPRYHRMTGRLAMFVIDELRSECSFTSVAKRVNLSVPTVIRIFDYVSFTKPKMPSAIAIDEFKGNTSGEKYQCIITDPQNHMVLDILPKRHTPYLSTYFRQSDRDGVKYFISDMWKPYSEIAATYFKNATPVVDKYHWIRQVIWAFDAVRKEVQKQFSKSHRVYFKHSRRLLLKRFRFLSDTDKQQVNVMLSTSSDLCSAHFLKEKFLEILDCQDRDSAKRLLIDWMEMARNSHLHSFVNCSNTMFNWFSGILNSFDCPYTNGFTEGCNNKIKVLKRNAYGYRNFNRFRKRILHMFSHQKAVTA